MWNINNSLKYLKENLVLLKCLSKISLFRCFSDSSFRVSAVSNESNTQLSYSQDESNSLLNSNSNGTEANVWPVSFPFKLNIGKGQQQ